MRRVQIDLDGLTILFVGLKLYGHIQWPWWKVVIPTIVSVGIQMWRSRLDGPTDD